MRQVPYSTGYWTSTTYETVVAKTALAVTFDDGFTAAPNDLSVGFLVRCVR
jgi:hypothetical protein